MQMDGVGVDKDKQVMVLAATNFPWEIDEALVRRLEKRIHIPLPDPEARHRMFDLNMRSIALASDMDVGLLASKTEVSKSERMRGVITAYLNCAGIQRGRYQSHLPRRCAGQYAARHRGQDARGDSQHAQGQGEKYFCPFLSSLSDARFVAARGADCAGRFRHCAEQDQAVGESGGY
jgi:hypothetical protein